MKNNKRILLRLKKSSLREVFYRAKEAILLWIMKKSLWELPHKIMAAAMNQVDVDVMELPTLSGTLYQEEIHHLINRKIRTLNTEPSTIQAFENGNRKTFFSDVKFSQYPPDIRSVWEPARLQHITALLFYAMIDPTSAVSARSRQFVKFLILKWIEKNPFLFGPHYVSVMECGLRIPVFFYCLKILDDLSFRERNIILEAIYSHAWLISKRLSLYSSLGNHTVAECVGLVFAGTLFRSYRSGEKWLKSGYELLCQEVTHQILKDGGPAEQSLNYHRFVLDLYWLSIDFLEKNTILDCTTIKKRLVQGETFLHAFKDCFGMHPSIGDNDDSCAIAPDLHPKRVIALHSDQATLESGHSTCFLVEDKNLQESDCQYDRSLLRADRTHKTSRGNVTYHIFPAAGYTLIRGADGSALSFDHGPLGMAPLYCHGHADALSITLTKFGTPVLVDPGTYRYNGASEFRAYFRSTRAHNTVSIDGMDQAVQETEFTWSKPYRVSPITYSREGNKLLLAAEHNGYARFKEPVWHKRTILFFDNSIIVIKDSFPGKGLHTFELNYHLHPDAVVKEHKGWWHITIDQHTIFMTLLNEESFSFAKGQVNPILGWYSPSYGSKQKCGVLQGIKSGAATASQFITAISTKLPNDIPELEEKAFES
jgi:hypothetical protein